MKRIAVTALLSALCLAAPATASADSGSITNVVPVGDGEVQGTYTTTSTTCTSDGFCGWFPFASKVPAGEACNDSSLTYVGNYQNESGTQTGTESFYPTADSVRLCLYIRGPDAVERLVAQYDYSPPPPASEAAPPLKVSEARETLPSILRREYGRRFTRRTNFRRSCYRWSTQRVRCTVRWDLPRRSEHA
jgi:hypothetical protein